MRVNGKLLLAGIFLAALLQSGLCRKRRRKSKRVQAKSPRKAKSGQETPEKPAERAPNPTQSAGAEATQVLEESLPKGLAEEGSEESAQASDEARENASTSNWSRHLESLMKSKFFRKSKGYYDSLHQCGLDYFERSIEYLTVKSSEYYSVVRQNEALRNGFLLLIYSFLLMKVCSVLCSCCRRSPQSSRALHKTVKQLQAENRQLQAKVSELAQKLGAASPDSEQMREFKESVLAEVRQVKAGEGKARREEEEIFTFFHDSLRDLWSEIKGIKSRLRETDVSQLSLNFDPKMFKMDASRKSFPRAPEDAAKNAEGPLKANYAEVLTGDLKEPLKGIQETAEESPAPRVEHEKPPSAPVPPKRVPPRERLLPKRTLPQNAPQTAKPSSIRPKEPVPQKLTSPSPPEPTEPTPLSKVPGEEKPISTEQSASNTEKAEQARPANPFDQAPAPEKTEPKSEGALDTPAEAGNAGPGSSEAREQAAPAKPVKPKMTPQKPILKGPRIPVRKIPSRMPNRRVPRKPLKLRKKPSLQSKPQKPTPTQGSMGI